MQVVYSRAHLGHDITTETVFGRQIPANEVAERAEIIRRHLEADGGFTFAEPSEHGESPIMAVHDPGLVRFVEEAWSRVEHEKLDLRYLVADTYPTFRMFEGMSPEFVAGQPEPEAVGGRAGWWGLDTANPLVEGTYGAARAAVDVALTTADLVLGGERAAYGLCRPPGHHAARSMAGGYCFFNNAAIAAEAIVRATGERVAILDVDYHHGNGTQQIFWRRGDVFYVSIHADPARQYPFFLGHANERGEGDGAGETLNLPQPVALSDEGISRRRRSGARGDPRPARLDHRRLARLRHIWPRPDRRLRPDDSRVSRGRPAGRGDGPAARHPPGGWLLPAGARRQRGRVAARRRGTLRRSGVPSRLVSENVNDVPSPTDLPANVRRLVDEIENEIGETVLAADDIAGEVSRDGGAGNGKVESAVREILLEIGDDPDREGLVGTPERVHRMYTELTAGYHVDPDRLINKAIFEVDYSEMVVVKDIPFYSLCEHHLLPFFGTAAVAYIPRGRVLGLSKIPRVVEMYARRLQIQERLTQQIADFLQTRLEPQGVGVVLEATHLCAVMRGVRKPGTIMTTSSVLGLFRSRDRTRAEFFAHLDRAAPGA